jgi:hypothetical protein
MEGMNRLRDHPPGLETLKKEQHPASWHEADGNAEMLIGSLDQQHLIC